MASAILSPAAPATARDSAATTRPAAASVHRWCKRYGQLTVHDRWGTKYVIRNDYWRGQEAQCLENTGRQTNFTIVAKPGHHNGQTVAFPNVFYGCSWGVCTPHAILPRRVSALPRLWVSWRFSGRARGTWNAAVEMWFARRPIRSGQAGGAELMVWPAEHGQCCSLATDARRVTVGHRRYILTHWIARRRGSWNYIQFRRTRQVSRLSGLPLLPIIKAAIRAGLIRRSWYLLNIEAGFEIWSHGKGLATRSFGVGFPRHR